MFLKSPDTHHRISFIRLVEDEEDEAALANRKATRVKRDKSKGFGGSSNPFLDDK